ncbi:Chaperone protein DnaJ [compost metagenome]
MIDYYEQLGVSRQATESEIKQAYRKLAKRYHPDVNHGNDQAESRFIEIVEAYETLSDAKLRAAYDERMTSGNHASQTHNGSKGTGQSFSQSQYNAAGVGTNRYDPARMKEQFEQFFNMSSSKGQTDSKSGKDAADGRNPLDTSAIFDHFFGFRKK